MSSEENPQQADQAGESLTLTDPTAMRALAHPVRMALMELLSVRDLTATQASELLGESPANCAFHLRTLAKYGFIEEAGGGKGRERPWRSRQHSINISSGRLPDRQSKVAAEALGELWHERWLNSIRSALTTRSWPKGWEEEAPSSSNSIAFLTPQEAGELNAELRELIDRYKPRRHNPELRPPGALPVQIITFSYPVADVAGSSPEGEPSDS